MYGRKRALAEPMTRERLRELFPGARLVCDCPSRREHCVKACDRFAGRSEQIAEFFGWEG